MSPDDLTKESVEKVEGIIYEKLENSFRANSMNYWAEISSGDLLVFLHADSF